jgi:sigma-B regulation protein RsbU (phosphoserine phosphatase)
MVRAMTVLRSLSRGSRAEELPDLVSRTNNELCLSNEAMMFVTAFAGLLELSTGRFTYVNAGHIPPQVYRKEEGKVLPLPVERNFVLGSVEDIPYKGQETVLGKGDILYLCTDGVTEAQDERGRFYGEERLRKAIASDPASPQAIREAVAKDLKEFAGKAEQFDDITMVVLGR